MPLIAAFLGRASGAIGAGLQALTWILDRLRGYTRLGVLLAVWYVVATLTTTLFAFVVYHVVGLFVLYSALLVTKWSIQLVISSFLAIAITVLALFASKLFPR